MKSSSTQTPRKLAFYCYLNALKGEKYIEQTIDDLYPDRLLKLKSSIPFVRELAAGTLRKYRLLDRQGKKLSQNGKLPAKRDEKALLRIALYERYFMKECPSYALISEYLAVAKECVSSYFARYLHAILKKSFEIPLEDSSKLSLSDRYGYPDYFVDMLIQQLPPEKVCEILEAQNSSPKLFARSVGTLEFELIQSTQIDALATSSSVYIQNPTQPKLLTKLLEKADANIRNRQKLLILDLCSAPGGKLIRALELYPHAAAYANDISMERIKRLKQNLSKFGYRAEISSFQAENFPLGQQFDVVIVDAPCSNSGVLSKRPEARLRLDKEHITALIHIQHAILNHALQLVRTGGYLIYMTCSILDVENQAQIRKIEGSNFNLIDEQLILPSQDGIEGGYGALVLKK